MVLYEYLFRVLLFAYLLNYALPYMTGGTVGFTSFLAANELGSCFR